jgi:hypothetical protein
LKPKKKSSLFYFCPINQLTFKFLFDVACLVIDGLIFGAQQVVKGFWFLGLYFVGLGWFVVCVDIA